VTLFPFDDFPIVYMTSDLFSLHELAYMTTTLKPNDANSKFKSIDIIRKLASGRLEEPHTLSYRNAMQILKSLIGVMPKDDLFNVPCNLYITFGNLGPRIFDRDEFVLSDEIIDFMVAHDSVSDVRMGTAAWITIARKMPITDVE
jgi:hypothetical protein